ncbi:hypothetical protein K9857_15905 [Pseudomonas sp. REP124]|uniref:hypothetical protein n=1 Tax=Pseudomonas sp. REP124 TaxID=2875731 RepID=UPI001CD0324C|nr:hypothetical protein [Pseudomonas sp. REP124]MBZ9783015.1 hypothetical protein [Pseudomonas sp. REP124]
MTNIHEQAMKYVYQQVLQRLLSFFSRAERTALQLLIQRLGVAAGGMERIGEFKVLAVQNGSRDNCYALALLRAAQLTIASRAPSTFRLRVASLRLNSSHPAALDNVHRSYNALFLYDDPRVEVLMVDNREVLAFDHAAPISPAGRATNRTNLLMLGHRRAWDGLFDLWDDCYLASGEFHAQISRWNHGVDALISCDSPRQQKQYHEGVRRAAIKAGLHFSSQHKPDSTGFFPLLDELGNQGYQRFYSEEGQLPWRPVDQFETCRRATVIDIHDMLVSNREERWPLLTEFLGFKPDELSAHLSDNEHVGLAVSAHLRGLQACFVEDSTYEDGVAEFLQRALVMIRRKHLPERLCEQAVEAFGNPLTLAELRARAAAEAQRSLGLSEAQMVCLVYAPFANKASQLERFLRQCHPGMLVALPDLHRAMQGYPVADQILQWLVDVSGLSINFIAKLYRMPRLPIPEGRPVDASGDQDEAEGDAPSMMGERSAGR